MSFISIEFEIVTKEQQPELVNAMSKGGMDLSSSWESDGTGIYPKGYFYSFAWTDPDPTSTEIDHIRKFAAVVKNLAPDEYRAIIWEPLFKRADAGYDVVEGREFLSHVNKSGMKLLKKMGFRFAVSVYDLD